MQRHTTPSAAESVVACKIFTAHPTHIQNHLTIEQPDPIETMESDSRADCFFRRRAEERRKYHRTTPKHVSDAVLQLLNQVADRIDKGVHPIELKRRLANYVQNRVSCPGFHRAEAEKAAGYVLEPASGEPGLPMEVLGKLLDQLDEADAKGQVSEYVDEQTALETGEPQGSGRGKWFVGVLKRRLLQYGITQRKKGQKRI
jgi:hypothetical protein